MDRLSLPPEPQRPPGAKVQPPVVYVEPTWEYKHLVRDLASDRAPEEAELNALGEDGWELAGAFTHGSEAHLYFKRQKS
jgi:hypothetical protein